MSKFISFKIFVIVHTFSLTSSLSLRYSDIKAANGSCPLRDSCSYPRSNDSIETHNCDCGKYCNEHRTCCLDSPFLNHSRIVDTRSTCRVIDQGQMSVFLVDNCSEFYEGPRTIRRMCEDEHEMDRGDPLGSAPVTNQKTKTTYKSLYCALCNMEKPQNLVIWQVYLDCSSLGDFMNVCTENHDFVVSNIMYVRESSQWGLWFWDKKSDWKFRHLPIFYRLPKQLENSVSECRPGLISDCPPNWRDYEVLKMCKAYMGAVYFPHAAFRNIHCAICNGVKNFTDLKCEPEYPPSFFRGTGAMSFSLLMDIDFRNGDNVGFVKKCQKGQVYDPFSKKCRYIECPIPGYKLVDDHCLREKNDE